VVTVRGRWYLVGHDRDREAVRTFRISRIEDDVTVIGQAGAAVRPPGVDLRAIVEEAIGDAPSGVRATVWIAEGRATEIRRAGISVGARTIGGREGEIIDLELDSTGQQARLIAGYGADALVLEPESLRSDVLARLSAHAKADRA
jgi:proteasome accessory factor B